MARRPLPPPEELTRADVLHVVLALIMIPLGVIILVHTLSIAVTATGILVGGAFIAFGAYRLWLAGSRYLMYRQNKGRSTR